MAKTPTVRPVTLRPSNKSWLGCSAQPWLLHRHRDYIPTDRGNQYTDEGTRAHDRAERHLKGVDLLSDPEDPVWSYVNEVNRQKAQGSTLLVESQTPLWYDEGYLGTVDAAWLGPQQLDILDLKYGMGVDVSAAQNTQMAIYWRSLYEDLLRWQLIDQFEPDAPVRMTIVQPRHWNLKKVDIWETTVEEILDFTDVIELKAEKIYAKRGLEFHPSEECCQFCPAKAVCVAAHRWELESLDVMEGDIQTIDPETIKELYLRSPGIKKWLGWIEKFVKDSVDADGAMSNFFTWGEGKRQGNTKWSDETEAVDTLMREFPELATDDFYTKTIKSPSKILDMLQKDYGVVDKDYLACKDLTFRPPPKPALVSREPGEKTQADELKEMFGKA